MKRFFIKSGWNSASLDWGHPVSYQSIKFYQLIIIGHQAVQHVNDIKTTVLM